MSTSRACLAALAAAAVLLVSPPASAAGGITSPGAGTVVKADAVVALRAVVEGPTDQPSELSLLAPGADTAEVVAVSTSPDGGELAHDFDTACASTVCSDRLPAANGTWTLRLSGAATDERTFVLRIPPAPPEEVEAVRSEAGAMVRWRQGDEPDLRGFRLETGSGRVLRDRIGLDACDPERMCSVEVPEQSGGWVVRAYRATCPDCTELLVSPASHSVRAEGEDGVIPPEPVTPAEAAAAASPRPSQAAAAPARRPDQRGAFLRTFGGNPPPPVPPALPPSRAALPVLPQGSYDQELGYGEREVVVTGTRPTLDRAQDAVGSLLGTGERIRLLVLSVLLVGGSLWLRRWARRAIVE